MEKQNTSLCVYISIHVHAEGREKMRKEHLPLILCLAHFVGVIGKEEVIIVDCTQAGLYLYTRGKNIVQRMWVQLWDRKDKGAL